MKKKLLVAFWVLVMAVVTAFGAAGCAFLQIPVKPSNPDSSTSQDSSSTGGNLTSGDETDKDDGSSDKGASKEDEKTSDSGSSASDDGSSKEEGKQDETPSGGSSGNDENGGETGDESGKQEEDEKPFSIAGRKLMFTVLGVPPTEEGPMAQLQAKVRGTTIEFGEDGSVTIKSPAIQKVEKGTYELFKLDNVDNQYAVEVDITEVTVNGVANGNSEVYIIPRFTIHTYQGEIMQLDATAVMPGAGLNASCFFNDITDYDFD